MKSIQVRMDTQGNAVEEKGSGNAEFQVPDSLISFSLLLIFIFLKATHSVNSQSQIVLKGLFWKGATLVSMLHPRLPQGNASSRT